MMVFFAPRMFFNRNGALFAAICLGGLLVTSTVWAGTGDGIALDGSIGAEAGGSLTPVAGNYAITSDMGEQAGGNLFHSFSDFNLETNESATFSGPDSVTNIISRVTGGNDSWIDGEIVSEIDGAGFYLLNPNGIVFGENASLNLGGAFYASSADTLHLGESDRLYVDLGEASRLSSAAPVAFGFLDNPGNITIQGSSLSAVEGETLAFVGGDFTMTDGRLSASGSGRVEIITVASEAEVTIGAGTLDVGGEVSGGNIQLEDGADIISTNGAGVTLMAQGEIQIVDSLINSYTTSADNGGSVLLSAGGSIDISKVDRSVSGINTTTYNTGSAGSVTLTTVSGAITLEGGSLESASRYAMATDVALGDAGSILLTSAQSIVLSSTASITSSILDSSGKGGEISLTAGDDLILTGFSFLRSDTHDSGDAGRIQLQVGGDFSLIDSYLTSDTTGSGQGGEIGVTAAGEMRLDATGSITSSTSGSGPGGSIDLVAATFILTGGGDIHAESSGTQSDSGDAGEIRIEADRIQIFASATIIAEAKIADGGNITLIAEELVQLADSQITTSVESGVGNGGNITIDPTFVILDNSSINANAHGGDGGAIDITTQHLITDPNSSITASSEFGLQGTVTINTPRDDADSQALSLSSSFQKVAKMLKERCSVSRQQKGSSLVRVGKGGMASGMSGFQTAQLLDLNPVVKRVSSFQAGESWDGSSQKQRVWMDQTRGGGALSELDWQQLSSAQKMGQEDFLRGGCRNSLRH
ncbi:MAG: filamentous hemagglutinin N-terminal domain-containing protein [Magnetococcales bacterium]|nr:filamentous hemagglutinin N-terminal domain-containing protein [Magnetococcales bacterium]